MFIYLFRKSSAWTSEHKQGASERSHIIYVFPKTNTNGVLQLSVLKTKTLIVFSSNADLSWLFDREIKICSWMCSVQIQLKSMYYYAKPNGLFSSKSNSNCFVFNHIFKNKNIIKLCKKTITSKIDNAFI